MLTQGGPLPPLPLPAPKNVSNEEIRKRKNEQKKNVYNVQRFEEARKHLSLEI